MVQVIELLFMTLSILVAAIKAGKVCVLIQHLTLVGKIFVDLIRITNHTLLIRILS